MDNEFNKTTDTIRRIVRECPWGREQTMENHIERLNGEIEELKEALENNDLEELKGELGDVFYDALFLLIIAEKEKDVDIEQVIRKIREKIHRRTPWLFGDMVGKVHTKEEADKVWNEIKQKEKEMGLR
jgi:NTP pyrophosphatase (non-canonical NTP hydrolase)